MGMGESTAAFAGPETDAEAMVLSCLPALRDALAKIVCALCEACRNRALESTGSDATRAVLRSAAAALEQSMGRENGFWRSDEYAVRCVVQLVAEEAELELLLTRLLQLLTASPRQNHVSRCFSTATAAPNSLLTVRGDGRRCARKKQSAA